MIVAFQQIQLSVLFLSTTTYHETTSSRKDREAGSTTRSKINKDHNRGLWYLLLVSH